MSVDEFKSQKYDNMGEMKAVNEFGDPPNDRAESLIKEGNEIMKDAWCCWFDKTRAVDAAVLYDQAGGQYKHTHNYETAAKYHLKAADLAAGADSLGDLITFYTNAAKNFVEFNKSEAVKFYEIAAETAIKKNDKRLAGKLYKELAEMEETLAFPLPSKRSKDEAEAIANTRKWCLSASNHYSLGSMVLIQGDNPVLGHSLQVKVADMSIVCGDYVKAIGVYEQSVESTLDQPAMRFASKGILYHALLSHLALYSEMSDADRATEDSKNCTDGDDDDGFDEIDFESKSKSERAKAKKWAEDKEKKKKDNIQGHYIIAKTRKYTEMLPILEGCHEIKFVIQCANALAKRNDVELATCISNYLSTYSADKVQFPVLMKVKANLKETLAKVPDLS